MTDGSALTVEGRSALLRLSAALAVGGERDWRFALADVPSETDAIAVEEVILQSYLFVGFPVVLNALAVRRETSPVPSSTTDPSTAVRRKAGEGLCRRVYGDAYTRLRAHVAGLHPDLDGWMIEEGYGKTLSRPGLSVADRELCVVALLAAAGHVPQLRSHLRGALNVGASVTDVGHALDVGLAAGRAEGGRSSAEASGRESGVRAAWQGVLARVGAD